jgi:hypothetical protein
MKIFIGTRLSTHRPQVRYFCAWLVEKKNSGDVRAYSTDGCVIVDGKSHKVSLASADVTA